MPGFANGFFTDVSGLSIEVGVVEQQVAGPKGDTITKKVIGTTSYGDITLKRSLSNNKEFYDWAQEVVLASTDEVRRDGSVAFHDATSYRGRPLGVLQSLPQEVVGVRPRCRQRRRHDGRDHIGHQGTERG